MNLKMLLRNDLAYAAEEFRVVRATHFLALRTAIGIVLVLLAGMAQAEDVNDDSPIFVSEAEPLLAEVDLNSSTESWPIKSRPLLRRDAAEKPATKPEDPRDVKLRELESRLDEAERELSETRAARVKAKDRKITIVADEAKTVSHIFRRYLDLGSPESPSH